MHDLRMIREHIEVLRDGMRRRGKLDALGGFIDRAQQVDGDRRSTIQALEERKASRNGITQEVAKRKRAGQDAEDLLSQSRTLGEEISRLESELAELESELEKAMLELPNVTLADVPEGGEAANRHVRSWGTPRESAGLKPHWDLGVALGLIDFERGAKISGSGFIVFRGKGARLVRALMNFMLDLHTSEHGYEEAWVPVVVNRKSMTGTSQLPKFEDDMYGLRDEDMFLIPTAEVPVTNLFADEILPAADLPRAVTAYSPCFRREAGAHGKDTRGLIRVHEFDKVELVLYATPETSSDELELLTGQAEAGAEVPGGLLGQRQVRLQLSDLPPAAPARLAATGGVQRAGDWFTVVLPADDDGSAVPDLVRDLVAIGARVHAVEPARISLEDRLLGILRAGHGGGG